MKVTPPLPSSHVFLLFTCVTALVLSNTAAVPHLSKGTSRNTEYGQRQSTSDEDGRLSFEQCSLLECKLPRFCKLISDPDSICSGAGACHCLPDLVQCSSHIHCVEGEVCAEVENFGTVCASETFVNEFAGATKLPGQKPPPPPFPSEDGLTFDPCDLPTCAFPRFCKTLVDEGRICTNDLACHCVPNSFIFCSSSRECVDGEICASAPDRGDVCVSESFAQHFSLQSVGSTEGTSGSSSGASPTPKAPTSPESSEGSAPSGSDGTGIETILEEAPEVPEVPEVTAGVGSLPFAPVCIGAKFLEHLPRDTLRFKVDSIALVFCDEYGSCATPGHMVQYNGEGMMMASYCKYAGCKRRMTKVNSPRYQRGMAIDSRTPGMKFTALAARYGTFAEEKILKVAMRFGL